jgi:two-component system cell cycle response regulator CtrA
MRILLVEKTRSTITSQIGDDRFLIACAEDADEALSLLQHERFDLVLLSMGAQPSDGFCLIRGMRADNDGTPILALTGSRAENRMEALRLGADMVLPEPVDPTELHTRIGSILRRAKEGSQSMLRLGDLCLCRIVRDARFRDTPVQLTPNEFAMLELLVQRKGTVLTKATFLRHLYEGTEGEPDGRIIDLFICKIRRKLERAGAGNLINTVWGHGYMVRDVEPRRHAADNVELPAVRFDSRLPLAFQRSQVRAGLSFDVWVREVS